MAAGPTSNGCAAAPHGGAINRSAYDEETESREESQKTTPGEHVATHSPDLNAQFLNGLLRVRSDAPWGFWRLG